MDRGTQHYLEKRQFWPLERQEPFPVTELPMHLIVVLPFKPLRSRLATGKAGLVL